MVIHRPNKYKDFFDLNEDILDGNPLLYYPVIETIKDLAKRKPPVQAIATIVKGEIGHIMFVHIDELCLIFSNAFDKEMFDALCDLLQFEKFKRFNFMGSKDILTMLFARYGAPFEIIKDRIIYKCSHVSDNFLYAKGDIRMGNLQNLPQLTEMGVAFSKAYDGSERSEQEAMATIIGGIRNDNIYQWEDNGRICSMAQVMAEEYDFPVIGHFYTDPELQGKGYGSSLIHRITKGLLDAGHPFCMLVADALNPASNKAFLKAGYLPTGEYMRIYKPR